MAAGFKISGQRQIMNNMLIQKSELLARVAVAAEKSAVDVSNHAKDNHVQGSGHGQGRFESETGTLVRSITPELETVSFDKVTAVVFTNIDYAMAVEFGSGNRRAYPFIFPALIANQRKFIERVKEARV